MKSPFFHLAGFAAGWAVQAFAHGRATDTAILLSALFFVAHRLLKEIQKGQEASLAVARAIARQALAASTGGEA